MIKYALYYIRALIRLGRTDRELSALINSLLDDPWTPITVHDEYSVSLGDLELWIANYPYCYGHRHDADGSSPPLPDRRTVYRLHERIETVKMLNNCFN